VFVDFFYLLKQVGIPVTPTSFLRLHKALAMGLITSLDDFYTGARTILVKNEKYFDLYDQVFAHHFEGVELSIPHESELDEIARAMLDEWLKDHGALANALGVREETLSLMTPDELLQYFLDRLREQTEEHHGGSKWIGTRGRSPVGHSGYHPGGMRIGGRSMNGSAVKTALERRYRDYSRSGPITVSQMGEALKRLKNMVPEGPKDCVNIDKTIYETMRKAGEIEIVYDRSLRDRMKVVLAIDNGGWSMEPHTEIVQPLFDHARAHFKDLKIYYFHNTIYERLWADPRRWTRPFAVDDLVRLDPETRLIIVGDANMAPYELTARNGSINFGEVSGKPSCEQLKRITDYFPHAVWINPLPSTGWDYSYTIRYMRSIFPMFELSLDGLEEAVRYLVRKR